MNWKTQMLPQMPGECLVPCGADKAPLEKAWQQKGYTAQQIAEMGDKVRSVGINTAKAKYVCIDLDGTDAFDFCQEQKLPLLPTWVIGRSNDTTRQKHIYYVSDEQAARLPIDAGKWKKGNLEVFWRSQQFIAAGEHPSGAYYTWDGTPDSVAQLPEAWIEFLPKRKDLAVAIQAVREIDLQSLLTREHSRLVDSGIGGEGSRNDNLFKLAADAYAAEDEALRRQSVDVRIVSTADELIQTALAKTDKVGFNRSEIEATLRSAREGRQLTAGFEDRWAYNVRAYRRDALQARGIKKSKDCRYLGIAELLPDGWTGKNGTAKTKLDCGSLMYMLGSILGDRLKYNLMGYEVEIDGLKISEDERPRLLGCIQNRGYSLGDEVLCQGLVAAGMDYQYHPVRDYLMSLDESDVDTMSLASEFLGQDDMLQNVMLQRFLVGAVARVMEPGCKMDYCCILQGKQGEGKSEFWKYLFGKQFYQSYNAGKNLDKDSYLALHCSWGIEIAEFDGMTNRDSAHLKNFVTTSTDLLRRPFGRKHEHMPRPSVFAGTCNTDDFLRDSTGERRYWVIEIPDSINIPKVHAWRDRIWAAVYADWKRGDKPFLPRELEALSAERNTLFSVESPLIDDIRILIRGRQWLYKKTVRDECKELNLVPIGLLDKEIKKAMQQLGWKQDRARMSQLRGQMYWRVSDEKNPLLEDKVRSEATLSIMGDKLSDSQRTYLRDRVNGQVRIEDT